jgi:hypothetical protein
MNKTLIMATLLVISMSTNGNVNATIQTGASNKYSQLSTNERRDKMIELFKEFIDKSKARDKGFTHYVNEFKEVCNDNGHLWNSLGAFCNAMKKIKSTTDAMKLKGAFESIGDNSIKSEMGKIAQEKGKIKLFLALRYRLARKA